MRGHIRKRGKGPWALIIDAGTTANGKRKQKWMTVRGTKKDAEAKLAEILNSQNKGTFVEPTKLTLGEYLEDWLKHIETQGYSRRTLVTYTHVCRRHMIPAIGDISLRKLHGIQIESYYSGALKDGRRQGQGGLSAKTVLDNHRVLNMALKKAVRQSLIIRNSCEDADPPKAGKYRALALEKNEI
jgi:hypothetical protein